MEARRGYELRTPTMPLFALGLVAKGGEVEALAEGGKS